MLTQSKPNHLSNLRTNFRDLIAGLLCVHGISKSEFITESILQRVAWHIEQNVIDKSKWELVVTQFTIDEVIAERFLKLIQFIARTKGCVDHEVEDVIFRTLTYVRRRIEDSHVASSQQQLKALVVSTARRRSIDVLRHRPKELLGQPGCADSTEAIGNVRDDRHTPLQEMLVSEEEELLTKNATSVHDIVARIEERIESDPNKTIGHLYEQWFVEYLLGNHEFALEYAEWIKQEISKLPYPNLSRDWLTKGLSLRSAVASSKVNLTFAKFDRCCIQKLKKSVFALPMLYSLMREQARGGSSLARPPIIEAIANQIGGKPSYVRPKSNRMRKSANDLSVAC